MRTFAPGLWNTTIDVRDFIQHNDTPYEGDSTFLSAPTKRTQELWQKLFLLIQEIIEDVTNTKQILSKYVTKF